MNDDASIFDTIAGVDLGGTKLLIRYRDRWLRRDTGMGFGAAELSDVLQRFLDEQGQAPAAIGIAVPGLVADGTTVAACDVLPGLVGWRPNLALGGIACVLVNDAKAALRASTMGLPQGGVAVTVMAGSAIGCGIVVDGLPLRGASGWAGELGYWPLPGTAAERLDQLAGGSFLAARLGCDGRTLAARAAAGDPAACTIVADGGRALGNALAGLVNLLNPHRLSVGGGALRLDGYWRAAEQALEAGALPPLRAACELRLVHDIEDLVALGAAQMAATVTF
ncbi:ROK family protein [Massilia sp. BHUDP2]|uniref:ROK family protein n=1 Tax=Massilia sp. BHUDP2 TaxID=3034505 RepID=UPI003905C79C